MATAAVLHVLLFGAILPLAAWQTRRTLERHPLPRRVPYFLSVIVQQAVFAAIALGVASALGIDLLPPYRPSRHHLLLGAGLLAIAVAALAPRWREQVRRRDRFIHLVAPRTLGERVLWAGVSVSAGVAEELAYRGVLFAILAPTVGAPGAVFLTALAFAAGHLAQGWQAAPVVFVFAVGFHLLVLASGTLVIAMAVHAAYDLIAGLAIGRLAERDGYPVDPLPPEDSRARPAATTAASDSTRSAG